MACLSDHVNFLPDPPKEDELFEEEVEADPCWKADNLSPSLPALGTETGT
jgi:hypothetical protein